MKRILPLLLVAALAGCVDDEPSNSELVPKDPDGTSENNGFAPQGTQIEAYEDDISLVGTYDTCEEGWCLDLVATNEGSSTYHVDAICANPFSDSMEQEGKPVQHRQLMAQCMAFGTSPFGPGEQLEYQFTWDQQVYDENDPSPASGAYEWTGSFRAYANEDGGNGPKVSVSHTVVAGAT